MKRITAAWYGIYIVTVLLIGPTLDFNPYEFSGEDCMNNREICDREYTLDQIKELLFMFFGFLGLSFGFLLETKEPNFNIRRFQRSIRVLARLYKPPK